MDEKTKQFAIRLLIVVVVITAFYYFASPMQNCLRGSLPITWCNAENGYNW